MFDIDRWKEIWASIKSNKLRTLLSGTTIALALFVFITLFGLSKGLQNGFEKEFFPQNVKAIYLNSGKTGKPFKGNKEGRIIQFKSQDYNWLEKKYADKTDIILPILNKSVTARNKSEYGNYTLIGTTPNVQTVEEHKIIKGRFLDEFDGKKLEKNIVIGRLLELDLFKNENSIGKYLQLQNSLYKIVGVFSNEDGDNNERLIYTPLQTLQIIYGSDFIDEFTIIPEKNLNLKQISALSKEISKELKIKHNIHPDDDRGIYVFDPSENLENTNQFFGIFTIIVLIIGIGSLIAGIVSIGNMMVFGVKERTKEIGIRKALGAKPRNIIGLILQEAVLITFIFGFIGIFIAILLTNSIKDSLEDYIIYNPTVETSRIIFASFILFFSGLLAGFIPARKAAKIKPIEALRDGE